MFVLLKISKLLKMTENKHLRSPLYPPCCHILLFFTVLGYLELLLHSREAF